MVSSFGIIALDGRKSKESKYTATTMKILQAFKFAALIFVCISLQSWDLAYNVHHELANQSI